MKTLDEHRKIVKKIADLAFANTFNLPNIEEFYKKHPKNWTDEMQTKFISKVHEGFKKAQKLLINEILYYECLLRKTKSELKEFRRKKDLENIKTSKIEIDIINQRISTFRHIADGIAWQLIGGEIHIARRFYIDEGSSKFLDSSNINHAIKVADEINKAPLNFALISDLTNFVQIGDILAKIDNTIKIIELKEGKINKQIMKFLDEQEYKKRPITDEVLKEKFDDKSVKQAKRILRQKLRAERIKEIIKTDAGIDPVSEKPIVIPTPQIDTKGYHDILLKLSNSLKTNTWSYTIIENCLHIGMYRDESILMANFAVELLLKKETDNYIIVDWMSITKNLSEPIFAKPFPPDFIIDILTGKIKIILGINLDKLIELFNELGIETKWLSKKETAKFKQLHKRKVMVISNNRAILMNIPNISEHAIMSGGVISKILYDNILPSNVALSMISSIKPDKE